MTLPEALWQQVRQRAGGACEYCGVTETDSGGPLTVDHFQPQARGGSDDLANLTLVFSSIKTEKDEVPFSPTATTSERAHQYFR
jgi:5-methylcytosine-specific restriction endonuclease McrA